MNDLQIIKNRLTMKKIHVYIIGLFVIVMGIASCGDNTDFSSLHTMTPEEIREQERQDSIAEANKDKINAHLILEYSVDITISGNLYDGAMLAIELDKIAEEFGITEEELLLGIEGESGAPEIKGFAIENSRRGDDYGSATNTNSPWGHWWDASGDVTTWGEDAMVFAEFDTEEGQFHVGQYPGHLEEGQTLTFIECLKYNERRVAVVVKVNAKAAGDITASVVNTQELSIDVTPNSKYETTMLDFDVEKTLSDLGISSMDDVKFVGVKENGKYDSEAVTGSGFWFNTDGFVCAYGEEAKLFTELEDDQVGIGQYPQGLAGGESITIQYGFLANNKIEMLKITVNVVSYEDPETPPAGEPESVELNIELTKPWDDTYSTVEKDLKEILREAFKMTTYQIHQAIETGDLKVYLNEITEEVSYTADVPGYWITSEGEPGGWGESLVWCSIGHSETSLYLYGGNHSGNAIPGDVISTQMIIVCNGVEVTINITFTLTEPEEE